MGDDRTGANHRAASNVPTNWQNDCIVPNPNIVLYTQTPSSIRNSSVPDTGFRLSK